MTLLLCHVLSCYDVDVNSKFTLSLQKMPGSSISSSASKRSIRSANKSNSDGAKNKKMSKTDNDSRVAKKVTKTRVTKISPLTDITNDTKNIKKAKESKVKSVKSPNDMSSNGTQNEAVINGSLVSPRTGQIYVGFHASSAGGVHNAILHTAEVGAESLALFLRPQRTWAAPPLKPEVAAQFRELRSRHALSPHLILPHGSYLLNLGSPDQDQRERSVAVLVEELQRCEELGLLLYNIHPGSSCGKISRQECVANIAAGINTAHGRTPGSRVKVVLENMACQGHTIGGDLRELRQIIDLVEDRGRVGVCLDTCHAMAAGYDLSTEAGFQRLLAEFEAGVGWEWLVGCHLNDSKGPAGCHRDRHENIGRGTIGLEGFRRIVNCPHFTDIPLILETPLDVKLGIKGYQEEIKLLQSLVSKK